MKTNRKGFIDLPMIIIIVLIIASCMYFYIEFQTYYEKSNNYTKLCEEKGGYIFDMYDGHIFCMKGEFIPIEGYQDIKTLDRLK